MAGSLYSYSFCHSWSIVTSYPGLLAPVFVACSTNAGEGLVKLSHAMTYLDVWRSGTFLLYSYKSAFWIQETSPRLSDVEFSVVLQSVFAIGSALACDFSGYVPLLHTSRYVIAWISFTRPSPVLVLQATNAGVTRPGYKARSIMLWITSHQKWAALDCP